MPNPPEMIITTPAKVIQPTAPGLTFLCDISNPPSGGAVIVTRAGSRLQTVRAGPSHNLAAAPGPATQGSCSARSSCEGKSKPADQLGQAAFHARYSNRATNQEPSKLTANNRTAARSAVATP